MIDVAAFDAALESWRRVHALYEAGRAGGEAEKEAEVEDVQKLNTKEIPQEERGRLIKELMAQMDLAAENLQFEKAAALRDQIADLKELKK